MHRSMAMFLLVFILMYLTSIIIIGYYYLIFCYFCVMYVLHGLSFIARLNYLGIHLQIQMLFLSEGLVMYFKQFILDFFGGLPEIELALPDYIYDFLDNFIDLVNIFVVFEDFSTLLAISVTYAFINVAFAFANFVISFHK